MESSPNRGSLEGNLFVAACPAPQIPWLGAIRFSLGRSTTNNEIETVVHRLKQAFAAV